jgi:predicted secreted hydrolase
MNYLKIVTLAMILITLLASSASAAIPVNSEGGHTEQMVNKTILGEWWYLNGNVELVDENGTKMNLAFYKTFAHQEDNRSFYLPDGTKFSAMMVFDGFYFSDGSVSHHYADAFIPSSMLGNFIALDTPYVNYTFPTALSTGNFQVSYSGSAENGYRLVDDNGNIQMNITYIPKVPTTVDDAQAPLRFITYEQSYGKLSGKITINGVNYTISKGEGYADHMIPMTNGFGWSMDSHGWNWIEITTKKYQGIFYGVRDLDDGYHNYTYKHLTIIDKNTGKILADYAGDDVTIAESNWISETSLGLFRPEVAVISAPGVQLSIDAEQPVLFDFSQPYNSGFIDFMAYDGNNDASITVNGTTEAGNGFFEYMVSNLGAVTSTI